MRLFDHPSMETRYGALVTLRRRDSDTQLRPEKIGDALNLYQISSTAPPAIAVSLRGEPEVALFGDVQPVRIDKFIFGPSGIIVKPDGTGQLRVSRFQVGKPDRRVVVPASGAALDRGSRRRRWQLWGCGHRPSACQVEGLSLRTIGHRSVAETAANLLPRRSLRGGVGRQRSRIHGQWRLANPQS